jgi:hypothetical protein
MKADIYAASTYLLIFTPFPHKCVIVSYRYRGIQVSSLIGQDGAQCSIKFGRLSFRRPSGVAMDWFDSLASCQCGSLRFCE